MAGDFTSNTYCSFQRQGTSYSAISFIKVVLCFLVIISPASGLMDGLYCGKDNCYDLLGVNRDSTKTEVTKAYRKLAKKWHPDVKKTKADKEEAEEMFKRIATAYEILRDEEQRNDYNYMLDHPEEYYAHYFYYYRRKAPKVDVRIVVVVTVSLISAFQYWGAWNNYNSALAYLVTVPKYRIQAMDIAKKRGLIDPKKKKDRHKTKEEIKEEEEEILKDVLKEKMDIRGGYRRPTVYDILWVQIILSPYHLVMFIYFHIRWIWKFTIRREEYERPEQEYIIRKYMKISQGQWESIEDHEKDKFVNLELWKHENYAKWKQEQEEEAKAKLAENSQYKMYRRYMKKGGPGQMTFGPD